MARDRDADNPSATAQSKRPSINRHDTSESQLSDPVGSSHHRPRHQKHVVGGGAGRMHARAPSSKALHKQQPPSQQQQQHRRHPSPEPERPPALAHAHTHRRAASDLKLTDESSASNHNLNLKKNHSHSNLVGKRNRSHAEIGKRTKSTTNIKRSSSHKDVHKLKGAKSQVHFDLGNDGQDEEWVDASASASPYLSRRGSVTSRNQSPAPKPPSRDEADRPRTPRPDPPADRQAPSPADRETAQHNNYITSRLLQRTPSHGAPPHMSAASVSVPPHSGSPGSQTSHGPPSLYGTPKTGAVVGSSGEELTSRFVHGSGPGSGPLLEVGSYFTQPHAGDVRRPKSLADLAQEHRDALSDEEEDDSALAPRTRRPHYRPAPAGQSRTQQKLNLQRASSNIEPTQAGGGVGAVRANPLVGSTDYNNRDPRIGKLLERTGMEYSVVRRYQNPIARSIGRLAQLPGANKYQHIPKHNGLNGSTHSKKLSELTGPSRSHLGQNLVDAARSRPTTPRQPPSIRTNGANSSFEAEEDRLHERMSGTSLMDGNDGGVDAILRSIWDRNMDLSASQD